MRVLVASGLLLIAFCAGAQAQQYPNRPIRLIVPYPAGGGADTPARIIAEGLSAVLRQPVLVDNRAGGNGVIGTAAVAQSKPDGYTLLWSTMSHSVNPGLSKLPYDSFKDFKPIAMVALSPLVLVVPPTLPASDVKSLIAHLKAKPGQPYASAGAGGAIQLAAELFKAEAQVDIRPINYKGEAPALPDLLSGRLSLAFITVPTATGHIRANTLKALAVTGSRRSPKLPNVPTVSEAALPNYKITAWNSIYAPAGTPESIVSRLSEAINETMKTPEVDKKLTDLGYETISDSTPQSATEHLASEMAKWKVITEKAGMKVE